jgi:hypothetical protein
MKRFHLFKGSQFWSEIIADADIEPVLHALRQTDVVMTDPGIRSVATIHGQKSSEKVVIPRVLIECCSDGDQVLARFFVAAGLVVLDTRTFTKAGFGNKAQYEEWFSKTFRPFLVSLGKVMDGQQMSALANTGAAALGHAETELGLQPLLQESSHEEIQHVTTVGAIALALGTEVSGPDPVVFGEGGDHRALCGERGTAYYISLNRLVGATQDERMADALWHLSRLGCCDAGRALKLGAGHAQVLRSDNSHPSGKGYRRL